MSTLMVQRLVAIAILAIWAGAITRLGAWGKVFAGGDQSMVPTHASYEQFALDFAWAPITLITLQLAAWLMGGVWPNGKILALTFAVGAVPGALMTLMHLPYMRAAIRVHETHEKMAARAGSTLEPVPKNVSLPGLAESTPIRQRVDLGGGRFLALSRMRREGRQIVVWSNVSQPNEGARDARHYSPPFEYSASGSEHERQTIAETVEHARGDIAKRLVWITASSIGLTIAAQPHRDERDARDLLSFAEDLERALAPSTSPAENEVL